MKSLLEHARPGFERRLQHHQVMGLGVLAISLSIGMLRAADVPPPKGVIAAAAGDSYRALAEEIASETGYPLADSPVPALAFNPEYVIWVINPAEVSDGDFVAYGQAVKDHRSVVALGIVTGGTIEKARALWKRRGKVSAHRVAAINGESLPASVSQGRIVTWPEGLRKEAPLTLKSLRTCLGESDCVSFTGHGTSTSLILDRSTKLRARDVPALPPLVVSTASCNTLRFWSERSIALAFVDQGAAAYIGFIYSPNAGYLLGAFEGLPFRYTWSEFTVGHAVQVLNRGCLQGFAAFPFYQLIGDPRMALSDRPPYEVVEDNETDGVRHITGRNAPAGVIPVRVQDGANFEYVRIPGAGAASVHDWLYNSRIQTANLGADKLLLFLHTGGDFVIELHRKAPARWRIGDTLLDSLDHNLIYNSQNAGDVIQLAVGGIAFACVGWRYRRERWRSWMVAGLAGMLFASLLACYVGLRSGEVTITSKPVAFSWLALLGVFLITASGSLLYVNARKFSGRLLGLCLACAAQLLPLIGIALFLFISEMRITSRLGAALWNYQLVLPNLIAMLVLPPLIFVCFELLRRFTIGNPLGTESDALLNSQQPQLP